MIKIKKNINKDAEKKYEYRFYRYLGLVLIILFSCIVTVSNLINPGETKKLISELVRKGYSDFFSMNYKIVINHFKRYMIHIQRMKI